MSKKKRLIGKELVKYGFISQEELFNALDAQRLSPTWKKLGKVLIDLEYINQDHLLKFLKENDYLYDNIKLTPQKIQKETLLDYGSLSGTVTCNDIKDLLKFIVIRNASDLHLKAGTHPTVRIQGAIKRINLEKLTPEKIKDFVLQIISPEQYEKFLQTKELDFSFSLPETGRFRVNIYIQRGSLSVAIRVISFDIPTLDSLGLPDTIKDIIAVQSGLIIVCGASGMGKSTTLAGIIDYLNRNKELNIITIEDPIEYLHKHNKSTVDQRELGRDTLSFKDALKSVVRQDPDVVMIGEMRDIDTIKSALSLSETGHLIFGTLHTLDAVHSINRIIDAFPNTEKDFIRTQLSMVLEAVICQQLVPTKNKDKRVAATEILRGTNSVRNLIRANELPQIYNIMQTGARSGMHTMIQSLVLLHKKGLISKEELYKRVKNPDDINVLI